MPLDLDPRFAPGAPAGGTPSVAFPRGPRGRGKADVIGRTPPHNVEAEMAVLAGILVRSDVLDDVMNILHEEDFYTPGHRAIYTVFKHLYEHRIPIDLVTVEDRLRTLGELEKVGGAAYLVELTNQVILAANTEHHAKLVREKAMQRSLINACTKIISNAYDCADDVPTLLEESEQAIFEIAQDTSSTSLVPLRELLPTAMTTMTELAASKDIVTGVTTGFPSLDKLTAGLQRTDLIILAARPSMGKTAFALNMALHAALRKNVVTAFFSLEMSRGQLLNRMLSAWGKVEMERLRRPGLLNAEDWQNLKDTADKLSLAPIFLDDTPALTTLELRARARRLKAKHDIGLLMVDYLQLMRASGMRQKDSRELEISEISRSLKALAKELDIPVVALAQLNRKVEERADKRPILSDLRESGAIEQDADVIMFIYRGDVYTFAKNERPENGRAEILVSKQRNGQVGVVELTYQSRYTSFESVEWQAQPSEDMGG
jgi:replicative DNA helicase